MDELLITLFVKDCLEKYKDVLLLLPGQKTHLLSECSLGVLVLRPSVLVGEEVAEMLVHGDPSVFERLLLPLALQDLPYLLFKSVNHGGDLAPWTGRISGGRAEGVPS